jgi:uncharacterized membrane protein YfcA
MEITFPISGVDTYIWLPPLVAFAISFFTSMAGVSGATLIGTFVTSVVGVAFYQVAAPFYGNMDVTPDWMLGSLFGLGGFCGMYLGARAQRFVSAVWLKWLLGIVLLFVALRYLSGLLEVLR